jgi:hypothetical protein
VKKKKMRQQGESEVWRKMGKNKEVDETEELGRRKRTLLEGSQRGKKNESSTSEKGASSASK